MSCRLGVLSPCENWRALFGAGEPISEGETLVHVVCRKDGHAGFDVLLRWKGIGMIAKLKGIVDEVGRGEMIIDVRGVGYRVHCGAFVLQQAVPGTEIQLRIDTEVREDRFELYGFTELDEQLAFRALLAVKGVGCRSALNILSTLDPVSLAAAVELGDHKALVRAEGVGAATRSALGHGAQGKVARF